MVYHACLLHGFRQVQRIGRRTGKCGSSQVFHDHHLALGISRGHRKRHGSQRLCAEIQSKSSGKQSVSIADMDDIICRQSGHGQTPGHTFSPQIRVILGIGHDRQLPGGAGCPLDTGHVALWNRKQAEGIILPQVLLCRKGKLADILDPFDISRLHSQLPHLVVVKIHVLIDLLYHLDQTLALQGCHLIPAHAFHLWVSDPFHPVF